MRLVLLDFMSLDGVCQAPGGPEEDLDNGFAHGMAAAWPARAGDPHADAMNSIRKYVASRTYTAGDLTWNNSHLLDGDAVAAVAAMKAQPGRELQMWGSTTLARALIAADLVDEYVLLVAPVLLGGGKSIFPTDGVQRRLTLVSLTPTATGASVCRLKPERNAADVPG